MNLGLVEVWSEARAANTDNSHEREDPAKFARHVGREEAELSASDANRFACL